MLDKLIESLSREQKRHLDELGIPSSRRSEWKNGVRRPTAAQIMTLARVAEVDPVPLLFWLAEEEASPAQRELFRAYKAERSGSTMSRLATDIMSVANLRLNAGFAQHSSGQTQIGTSSTQCTL